MLYNNICQRIFFSIIKLAFWEKREFRLFYYKATFKDSVLFELTQSSIEIGLIVVKKHVFLNFNGKYLRLKWKKKVDLVITFIWYAWIGLNKQDSEYASSFKIRSSCPKFWIWQSSEYGRVLNMWVLHSTEYAKICLDHVLNISQILNMPALWLWQGSE